MSCRGYRESLASRPWSMIPQIMTLARRFGVIEFVDPGNNWEALRYAIDQLGCAGLEVAGPVLTEVEPCHEIERVVTDEEGVERAIRVAVIEGASWIMIGSHVSARVAKMICSAARDAGLRVGARPGTITGVELAELGVDTVYGGVSAVARAGDTDLSVAEFAMQWADREPEREAQVVGSALVDANVALVTEYIASRRGLLLEEAINARLLEELVPVLPATRYLIEMRKAGGQRIGRRAMAEHGAMPNLGRRDRARVSEGLARIGACLAALQRGGVRVVPGSGSPGLGVVPGVGLWEELSALCAHGCDAMELLNQMIVPNREEIRVALGADPRRDPLAAFAVVAALRCGVPGVSADAANAMAAP